MKPSRLIISLAASVLIGVVLSGVATMTVWNVCIDDKAFHCFDIGFGSYWTDIDLHRTCGDTISPGWTWDTLKIVREQYIEAFWLLWAAISLISFWIFRKLRPNKSLQPTPGIASVTNSRLSPGVAEL